MEAVAEVAGFLEPAPVRAAAVHEAEVGRHGSDRAIPPLVEDVGSDHPLVVPRHRGDVGPSIVQHFERLNAHRQEDVDRGVHGRTPGRPQAPMGTQVEGSSESGRSLDGLVAFPWPHSFARDGVMAASAGWTGFFADVLPVPGYRLGVRGGPWWLHMMAALVRLWVQRGQGGLSMDRT